MQAAKSRRKADEAVVTNIRTGLSIKALKQAFINNLFYLQGRFPVVATRNDNYMALAYTVRDRLLERWTQTSLNYLVKRVRTVCYLSAEFLLGPHLGNNLVNLGVYEKVRQAMHELGHDLEGLLAQEEEPGLGNGGLGRLAACFVDSMATLGLPGYGYGIRYEFGIFEQAIRELARRGHKITTTDKNIANPVMLYRDPDTGMIYAAGDPRANRHADALEEISP